MTNKRCSFPGCTRPYRKGGYCYGHGRQVDSGESLTALVPRPRTRPTVDVRDELGRKQCARCLAWKAPDDYHRDSDAPDGLQGRCKDCGRHMRLLKLFNLSLTDYNRLLAEQGGCCAICQQPCPTGRSLQVDHDHACCPDKSTSCGKCVRGLLCWGCNVAIGHMRDEPERLMAAAAYLITTKSVAPQAD